MAELQNTTITNTLKVNTISDVLSINSTSGPVTVTGVFQSDSATNFNLGTAAYPVTQIWTNNIYCYGSLYLNTPGKYALRPYSNNTLIIGSYTWDYTTLEANGRIVLRSQKKDISGTTSSVEFAYPANAASFRTVSNNDVYLGDSNHKWISVYATAGTIQTSDRAAKSDIHYLDSIIKTRSVVSNSNNNSFTTQDVIDFIQKLNPATFTYGNSVKEDLDNNNTEMVQLGLIADDIKDEPLFNFIGATMEYQDEETQEEKTSLGLKPIPLATLALTACKYLINKLEEKEII